VPISRNDAPLEFGAEEGETVLSVSASEIHTDMDEELQIKCVSAEEVILAKQPMASDVPDSEFTVYSPSGFLQLHLHSSQVLASKVWSLLQLL